MTLLRPGERFPWINLILFLLTIVSTLIAGASMAGLEKFDWLEIVRRGWTFSLPLIFALGAHEMGHFVAARRHGLEPSWPYFIPAPTFVGTFGAVIRMRFTTPPTRAQLFDIGVAGPIAGFVVSVGLLVAGAALSHADPHAAALKTYSLAEGLLVYFVQGDPSVITRALEGPFLLLGDSLLVKGVIYLVTGSSSAVVVLHPVGFAGWVGLFVTLLNLIPIGQLDGGHAAYALLGEKFKLMPWVVFPVLVVLGLAGWAGWLFWAGLIGLLGVGHPPASAEPLGARRMALAWGCLVIFVLIFTPAPLQPAW